MSATDLAPYPSGDRPKGFLDEIALKYQRAFEANDFNNAVMLAACPA